MPYTELHGLSRRIPVKKWGRISIELSLDVPRSFRVAFDGEEVGSAALVGQPADTYDSLVSIVGESYVWKSRRLRSLSTISSWSDSLSSRL